MRLLTSFVLVAVLIGGVACEQKSGDVLVEVGKEVITQPDLDLLVKVNPRLQRRMATPAGKQQIIENYVEQALMFQEAKKQGLPRDPDVKAKIALYNKVILAQALLEAKLEEATRKYYDDNQDEFEKISLAHIYIPFKTEKPNRALGKEAKVKRSAEQAAKIAAKISEELKKDPAKFGDLVEKKSEDRRTKKREGDLGWLTLKDARMERWGWSLVAQQAFPLAAGAITDPIKSGNGYHLVKVLETKKMDDFEQAKARIRFKIQTKVKAELVNALKEAYKVSYVEDVAPEEMEKVEQVIEEAADQESGS